MKDIIPNLAFTILIAFVIIFVFSTFVFYLISQKVLFNITVLVVFLLILISIFIGRYNKAKLKNKNNPFWISIGKPLIVFLLIMILSFVLLYFIITLSIM